MKTRLSLILLACLAVVANLQAQYYVSPTGLDTNPGSFQQPFLTIQKAASLMVAGDTCFIMAGTYRETVIPVNSGSTNAPIVFTNYQNDKVFLVGTDTVTNWQPYQNGIYRTYIHDTVWQLNVGKYMANEARYPNFKGNHQSTADWKAVTTDTLGRAVFSGTNFPVNYWKGGIVVANVGSKWVSANGRIDSSAANTLYCPKRSSPWKSFPAYSPTVYTGSGKGYIIKHLHALDTVNEWHWQNDSLYYYPENPSMINSLAVEARTRIYGFVCDQSSNVVIRGLHFVWSSVSMENATGCVLDGISVFYPRPFFWFNTSWGRQAHDNNNYGISKWEGKGVAISGDSNVIRNAYIAFSWGDGISIGGRNNKVENCLAEDCDWIANDCAVVCTIGKSHSLSGNTLRNAGRCIAVNRLSQKTNILYNDMYNCGNLTQDLGITYSYRSNGDSAEIAYNWVHDNHSTTSNMGIYLDNYDTAYIVHHNVIWKCTNAIQTNKPAVNHQIYNNTAWFCTNAMGAWGNAGTTIQNQKVRNNLSNKAWNQGNTFSNNLVTANPLFTNANAYDFTLQAGSPAIDYGMVIPVFADTFAGSAPDAGAYEYGLPSWTPGSGTTVPNISEIYLDPTQIALGEETVIKKNETLRIYPNPTRGKVSIVCESTGDLVVEIYNAQGRKILDAGNTLSADLSAFPNGIYIIRARDSAGKKTFTSKLLLSK